MGKKKPMARAISFFALGCKLQASASVGSKGISGTQGQVLHAAVDKKDGGFVSLLCSGGFVIAHKSFCFEVGHQISAQSETGRGLCCKLKNAQRGSKSRSVG